MCTVTWVRETGDGYTLCVSRDERRTRRPASPPKVQSADGVRFLAPRDGERGGSWVAVNERGVSVCLLNRYDNGAAALLRATPSRGSLIARLASSGGLEEVAHRLQGWDLSRFPPFALLGLHPGQPAFVVDWMGAALCGDFEAENRRPLVSSSMVQDAALRARKELFERIRAGGLTRDALLDFHASHEPERGALSPCMHREDAATVSFTAIDVSPREVRMTYQQGTPCEGGPAFRQSMPRKVRRNVRAA